MEWPLGYIVKWKKKVVKVYRYATVYLRDLGNAKTDRAYQKDSGANKKNVPTGQRI